MSEVDVQTRWIRKPRSLWRQMVGWGALGIGLLGVILPIIPGIPLLIFGLVVLSTQYRWAHTAMVWMKKKYHQHKPGTPPPAS